MKTAQITATIEQIANQTPITGVDTRERLYHGAYNPEGLTRKCYYQIDGNTVNIFRRAKAQNEGEVEMKIFKKFRLEGDILIEISLKQNNDERRLLSSNSEMFSDVAYTVLQCEKNKYAFCPELFSTVQFQSEQGKLEVVFAVIRLKVSYDEEFLSALKNLIPAGSRKFDPAHKIWYIDTMYYAALCELVTRFPNVIVP